MVYILAILLLAVSVYALYLRRSLKTVGTLRIDNSDPEDGPYLFLELAEGSNPNNFKNRAYVTFKVNATNFISHE